MLDTRTGNPLREQGHDAALNEFNARVTQVERPSESLLRVSVYLPESGSNDDWLEPNIAVRFYLPAGTRVYTVRSYDRGREVAVIDVVQHEKPSVMMDWSNSVKVGDTFALTGPRPHVGLPEASRLALFADDTAMPALYSLLQYWPEGAAGNAWVSTSDQEAFYELPLVSGLELHYVDPESKSLATIARTITDGEGLGIWAAGERDEMKDIRRYFRNEIGMDKSAVRVAGYWKIDTTNAQIDEHRRAAYLRGLSEGKGLEDFDDLDLAI
ncbi:siderophore-interacting protein [Corynebacterium casei]|uniref:siderophore-interacting protein n=1 Tax=Corynebacterium casei TaxID=160386 RepID=UPI003F923260